MFTTLLAVVKTAVIVSATIHAGGYTVQPGNTLSGIAATHDTSWQQLYAANYEVVGPNPNLIQVGEVLQLSPAGSASPSTLPVAAPAEPAVPTPAAPDSAPSGVSIPGMPSSLANCIWMRESTDGTNPAAHGNQFGIIPASGYNVSGQSVAQQEATAGQIYATSGGAAWAADGCPGT